MCGSIAICSTANSCSLAHRIIATSLDGYIAGPAGEMDWFFTEPDDQKQEPPQVTLSTAC